VTELAATTRVTHESYIRRVIRPVVGDVKARNIGPDTLDSLNSALKRCSRLYGRLPKTGHHAEGPHACAGRCGRLRDHRTPPACLRPSLRAAPGQAAEVFLAAYGAVDRLRGPVAGQTVQVDR
jgi:hypothetical protein